MKSKKVNLKKFIENMVMILIIIFLIFVTVKIITSMFKKEENPNVALTENNEIQETENAVIPEQNNELDSNDELTQDNMQKEIDKNHLSNTEASFGTLDVPVYKKDEKNLKLPILIYHAFQTPQPDGEIGGLFSTQARFEENITTLLDAGYTFITLEDIYKYEKGYIGLPEKNITITMDDGWLGCYVEAFDKLVEYNVPATIFIVEDLMDKEGYISWEQAKEMYDTGLVKIHVHGRKHVDATGYSKEELIADYNHTHAKIEEELGDKISKIMAYPAGASSESTIEWLKEAGFEIQVQTKYGTVNKTQTLDLTDLGRVRAEQATGQRILNAINY